MEILQERILKILFVLIWALALVHMMAEYYYLYWIFRWFDIVTHFFGGVWVGIAAIWFWYLSGYIKAMHFPKKKAVLVALLFGLLIGFLWEGYEYVVWQLVGKGLPPNYIPDTTLDLVMDCMGAYLGFFALSRFFFKAHPQVVS